MVKAKEREGLRLGFVGAGVVGTTLAIALFRCGYRVVACASRSRAAPRRLAATVPGCVAVDTPQEVVNSADLVFLTVPDDAIQGVAASLTWRPGQAAVHCSGAYSRDVLAVPHEQGADTGSLHPMQTFPDADSALNSLDGIVFGIEAEGALLEVLQGMACALGGTPVVLRSQDKPLYHASAIMACGYVLALLHQASGLWEALGLSPEEGLRALLPLTRATLEGATRQGPVSALTGPIARGDVGTVRRHLEALQAQAPAVVPLYCSLGLATLPLAQAKGGLSPAQARELRDLLEETLGRVGYSKLPSPVHL